MKKTHIYMLWIIVFFVSQLILAYFVDLPGWFLATKWHIFNDSTVRHKNIVIDLPPRWFVLDKGENSIVLASAALSGDRRKSNVGVLIVIDEKATFEQFEKRSKCIKSSDSVVLALYGHDYFKIDNKAALEYRYKYIDKRGVEYIEKHITVPDESLYIKGSKIAFAGLGEFENQLNRIKFVEP